MQPSKHTHDLQAQLANTGWMRELAKSLVHDEAAANDVVQQAWLHAVEKPPASRWNLRAWLFGTTRNLAKQQLRSESARKIREQKSADAESLSSTSEIVERAEMHQKVVQAVLALEEPYRSTILYRFFDGLSHEQIAKETGEPSSTIRTRQQRALEQLRVRLDGSFGTERQNWCLALIPLAAASHNASLTAAGSTVSWWVIMSSKAKAAVAALLLISVTGGFYYWSGASRGTKSEAALPALAEKSNSASSGSSRNQAPDKPIQTPDPAHRDPVEDAGRNSRTAVQNTPRISGRIVNSRYESIPSVELKLQLRNNQDLVIPVQNSGEFEAFPYSAGVDTTETQFSLTASAPGFETRKIFVEIGKPATILLLALPSLTGFVQTPAGTVLETPARVTILVKNDQAEQNFEAFTDLAGNFRIDSIVPGEMTFVEARARGFAAATSKPNMKLLLDHTHRFDLELSTGVLIEGIVVDAATKKPIPSAQVWAESWIYTPDREIPTAVADENGRFRLVGVSPPQTWMNDNRQLIWFAVHAQSPGFQSNRGPGIGSTWNSEGRYFLEIPLARAQGSVSGIVVGPDNKPISSATVVIIDGLSNLQNLSVNSEGRFEVNNLGVGKASLLALHETPEGPHCGREQVEIGDSPTPEIRLVIPDTADASIEGRVRDAQGNPAANVPVEASFVFQTHSIAVCLHNWRTSTDADGKYRFVKLTPSTYYIRIATNSDNPQIATPDSTPVTLKAGTHSKELDFVIQNASIFAGKLALNGHDAKRLILDLRRINAPEDEELIQERPEVDGSFIFSPAKVDSYKLKVLLGKQVLYEQIVGPQSDMKLSCDLPPLR